MNQETQGLSKQQIKSRETRAKIFQAAKRILQKQGYEQLSIKNICEEAGVSNGSFYHHFKTKDDLLSYYIEEQPSINPDLLDTPEDADEAKIGIIHIYLNYAQYCRELGVEFMSIFYTPRNQALNPTIRTERPYPILTVENYLRKAIDTGIIAHYIAYPFYEIRQTHILLFFLCYIIYQLSQIVYGIKVTLLAAKQSGYVCRGAKSSERVVFQN